jgi:FlaA1/EpsC-like NDP-sugar epimerase
VEIVFTGTRPGEKLTEELWEAGTPLEQTLHPDIFRLASSETLNGRDLQASVDSLRAACHRSDANAIIQILTSAVPGASIRDPETLSQFDAASL